MTEPLYYEGQDISFSRPTQDAERELFRRIRSGDLEARETLIKNHLLFAAKIAQSLNPHRPDVDADELISAANLGLLDAIDKFDPGHGCLFCTFAWKHISGRVRHFVTERMDIAARERHGVFDSVEEDSIDPDNGEEEFQAYRLDAVRAVAADLPEADRALLHAVIFERKTFTQIGRELNPPLTLEGARQRYLKVLAKVRQAVAKRFPEACDE